MLGDLQFKLDSYSFFCKASRASRAGWEGGQNTRLEMSFMWFIEIIKVKIVLSHQILYQQQKQPCWDERADLKLGSRPIL